MTSRGLSIVFVLALTAGGCSPRVEGRDKGRGQAESAAATQVLDGVSEPDDDAIRKITDAEQWHNPYVVVNRDNYELILPDQPRTAERWNLAALEEALLKLPLARWPLGRVVAVQENALRSKGDDEKIATNLRALKRMLESHKVRADLWPTG